MENTKVDDMPKKRISLFAIVSLLLAICVPFMLHNMWQGGLDLTTFIVGTTLCLLLSIASHRHIMRNTNCLRGRICSLLSITISLIWLIGIPASVVVPSIIQAQIQSQELEKRKETFNGNSENLKKTTIVPTLDTPGPSNNNIVWCSSSQIAWNTLKDTVIGEPILVDGAENLCNSLNNAEQSSADLVEKSYFTAAGFVKDGIVETIQSEMAKRFPSEPTPQFDALGPDYIISYSYLTGEIKFKTPFREVKEGFTFKDSQGNEALIAGFGVWEGYLPIYKNICEQIEVLYYNPLPEVGTPDTGVTEFALDLCKHSSPYQVVVACVEHKETLNKTLDNLQNKIANFKKDSRSEFLRKFDKVDILMVPNMFWKIVHHFKELEKKPLLNKDYEGMPIIDASQTIRFRLDRSGVILRSEARFVVGAVPREFVFNKPFLIYLKKRDAEHPFFVMWVANAELLSEI
jgi:hypothetical protein